ncbi:hypothetical protein OIPHN069_44090 (plasmid) [Enterobacter hormaechei subsp. hoffmannii]|nr:hypothetical protein TMSI_52810 [Klebsiella quasipneumoniae]BBM27894.1 hypothetical protein OIPHN069_44090 [Enterobacter hormaechei subsp. hoffmannii]
MGQTNWWALRQQGSKAIQLQVMNVFIQQDTRGAVHQRIERMYFTQVPSSRMVQRSALSPWETDA